MISLLRGTIRKNSRGVVTVDVRGVGYAVTVPLNVWEQLKEGAQEELTIVTFVREDRFDLFGFLDSASKALFIAAIDMPGIGPKLALEICAVPRHILLTAIETQEVGMLTAIKGVGKKTAEKLLLDLKNLMEKQPEIFAKKHGDPGSGAEYDQDAVDALTTLGFDVPTALSTLKNIPKELKTSEERVAAALRTL
ncbi:MAG: Holliday junction branch migration protein RuvA [Candidatus Peribacteraceae bacterium]|jgi:Holliday junction DNA helicase RuvA